ncbi:uncharacterized protein OCT59_007997 [Rhizophagus irregularis]|uniref:uncharacterized protein n=1 Tax=Rhizophagus irregularis TaxID=588596 RepID=UPI0019E6B8B4|nr:hypothetical protein OCT59_007997 [Rhizophagus irregularis]GBC42943.2 hypothetical protein GLOIN_2v1474383 [Rhizophagus irregularis DAOM 181602=DAOM 197198]
MPSHAWYTTLVAQDPHNRHAVQWSNGSWTVIDYSAGLHVLDLHNEAKAFDFTTKNISNEERNHNAGYIYFRIQEEERSLIPLLPGYVAFTTAGKNRFKLSILESNNQLLFFWEEFGLDVSYSNRKAHGVERLAFHCMLKKYNLESNTTIRSILGLYDPQVINKLQRLVYEKFPLRYPTIFQMESPAVLSENLQNNAKKKEETLHQKITTINNKSENTIETDDIIALNDAEIQKSVEKELEEKRLGSVIFMSTSQYLSMLLSLPCPNCLDIIASNRTFYTRVSGFSVSCVITCHLCKASTQYSNEDSGVKYSNLVAEAALAGGINRNSFQTALATIGVTNQCSEKSFYNYQARMCKPIIDSAKFSSDIILREILDNLESAHLPGQEKVLPVGFDCSWSHARNAHQASGEFLYLGDLPGYNYQPVIGFHTVEHSRVIRKSENDSSKIIYNGNFSGTSRQMEHAILLVLLNDIMPILEQTDFTLHVCVDGDLETNRTLACIPAVGRIFADLKHISKNIRKNLMKKQYSRWHSFEQHIMRYFNSCIFSAGLQRKLNQDNAPTEEETRYIQVEGLIRHLLDDHSICWSDVCWIKDNPELQLQDPTLKNYTQTEIENFRSVITTIFRVPSGQGIVTTLRTSHNETFNRKILKYLDKWIDYWASYSTRHALAVLDQNEGLDVMISKVHTAATEKEFSHSDICNILKFVKERSQKELVSYKSKTPDQIHKDTFWPSFGNILRDFDVIVKCVACHAFAKKSARGLCGICSFYVDAGLWERIVNDKYIPKGQQPEPLIMETLISLAAKNTFGFDNF